MFLRVLIIGALGYWIWKKSQIFLPAPKKPHGPTGTTPWKVLGIKPGASDEAIRAAYQEKVQKYHPDRVEGMGPEVVAVAERHTQEINAAYDALKNRGSK